MASTKRVPSWVIDQRPSSVRPLVYHLDLTDLADPDIDQERMRYERTWRPSDHEEGTPCAE